MPSTITCRRGQVVVLNVPFTGQGGSKRRPAVVLSTAAFHRKLPDVIVCPISSQPRFHSRPGAGDHPLHHWREVGLRHPSTARLSNILAVDKRLIERVLGTLPAQDIDLLRNGLRLAFGL